METKKSSLTHLTKKEHFSIVVGYDYKQSIYSEFCMFIFQFCSQLCFQLPTWTFCINISSWFEIYLKFSFSAHFCGISNNNKYFHKFYNVILSYYLFDNIKYHCFIPWQILPLISILAFS